VFTPRRADAAAASQPACPPLLLPHQTTNHFSYPEFIGDYIFYKVGLFFCKKTNIINVFWQKNTKKPAK